MSETPTDVRYSADHLWVRRTSADDLARLGITDFAQESLGDVLEVTLPELGQVVSSGQACGLVESTKSSNDLVSPLDGTVRSRNETLNDHPEVVNADPYGEGWMFEIEVAPSTLGDQLAQLMDAGAYKEMVGS